MLVVVAVVNTVKMEQVEVLAEQAVAVRGEYLIVLLQLAEPLILAVAVVAVDVNQVWLILLLVLAVLAS